MIQDLKDFSVYSSFQEAFEPHSKIAVEPLWPTPKALLAASCAQINQSAVLYITSKNEENRLSVDIPQFTQAQLLEWAAWETLPGENQEPSPDIVGERAQTLKKLISSQSPSIILSSLSALLTPLVNPDTFEALCIDFEVGEEYLFEDLAEQLVDLGYERVSLVNDKGQFALRGEILDLFPSSETEPFRLEFFGDELESIRSFDPISQKSVQQIKQLQVLQTKELELLKKYEHHSSLLDFLPKNTCIIIDRPQLLESQYQDIYSELNEGASHTLNWKQFMKQVESFKQVVFEDEISSKNYSSYFKWTHPFSRLDDVFASKTKIFQDKEQAYLVKLPSTESPDFELNYLCPNDAEEKSLKEQMEETYGHIPTNVRFTRGAWTSGFVLVNQQKAYITASEVTHRYAIKRKKQRTSYHAAPLEFMELEAGSYVVHIQHGIAKFLGWEKQKNHAGVFSDFLKLEYADKAVVYVPLDQSHLVSKFVGSKGEKPKLHQVGGKQWVRTKVQTERAIMDYASELLRNQAQRELKKGFHYPEDSPDQELFEKEFPYIETADQLKSIEAIKEDFTSPKAMDRLVCGDVGYGKTEVAMRAAFKAVVDGKKQVAVLVPTTVLALQHYETFTKRMANFPVRVAQLSRFVPLAEQKKVIKGLYEGSVDIVIGTHRVISKDVEFKNLGLVIIDEEQRFGVKAKEHLKAMKVGADCLTLSATPIPRTLYMSLVGARDISVINSPPQDRLPIKTHLIETDEKIIKQAILRELARGGQVYIIHNRVQSIHEFSDKIRKWVPQAKVIIGHGQMSADELDEVFHQFKNKQANVLIATTIIENGIDIPEANTILIDRADRFGLSELYQLRGRVGRWNKKAYAYFLVPKNRVLLEVAEKRLKALIENSGYGGGMKIAMRDLEIRGAGDILGTSQSGQISAVGFHLYCKLLKRTILSMQGKAPKVIIETKMDFPFDYQIPEEYIPDLSLRMELYQRIGESYSLEELEELEKEIVDRFGDYPDSFAWLYHVMRVKLVASSRKLVALSYKKPILKGERREKGELKVYKAPFSLSDDPKQFEEEAICTIKQW